MPRHSLHGQPEVDDSCSLRESNFLEHLSVLKEYCTRKTFARGECIFREGEMTHVFYVLLKGSVVREAIPWPKGDGLRSSPVHSQQLIGAAHFMTRSQFRETQSADDECEMLIIDADVLDILRNTETEAYIALLREASSSLGVLIRNFISFGLNRVWLRSGEHVFMVNEDATSMFVIISGRVRLQQSRNRRGEDEIITRERGRGDTIGEAPLLAHGKYSSTATTSRDSELVRMSHGALVLINAHHSEVSSRLLELVACKLQNNLRDGDRAHAELVTICLIPSDATTKINEFAGALQQALSMFGSTLLLTSSVIDEIFEDGTARRLDNLFYRSKLTSWMAQQEEEHRFIVLQADAHSSSWSKVCASQADCVLVVAHANRENTTPLMHEQRLIWRTRHSSVRAELVLIHEIGSTPSGTNSWREKRQTLARHHHVRLSSKDDMSRLARYVSGHSVGVILTGGGGGGLAHIGALRSLEDNGIPIDCIGGTSQGTLTAGMYARTLSTAHILPTLRNNMHVLNSPHHLLTDLTLPLLSLFSGKGLDNIIKASVGDTDIEDLWLNFFCCSTNLTKNSLTVHTSGRLWRCIRASMTVLGLLPPVRNENGELLVDGGYLNSVPVDVMRKEMGVETVIVVDVEDKDFLSFRDLTPHDGGLSSFGLLWDRLNPFSASKSEDDKMKHPSYADVLNALTATTKKKHLELVARDHRINMHLRPPGVSLWMANSMTVPQMDAAVRKAQAYTNVAIEKWKSKVLEQRTSHDNVEKPHAELEMAYQAAVASDPDSGVNSPSLSPHISPRSSLDSVRHVAEIRPQMTTRPHVPNHQVNISTKSNDNEPQRYHRKSSSRAAHLPSNDCDSPIGLSQQHSSQLVRTFTDQAQVTDETLEDPTFFMTSSSKPVSG
jgi:lysophospholipid hydrolase